MHKRRYKNTLAFDTVSVAMDEIYKFIVYGIFIRQLYIR